MRKASTPKDNLSSTKIKESIYFLRAMSHPLRMEILEYIDRHKCVNVNRIYAALHLEQSITSQHLRILRAAGLVLTSREGKFIHYSVAYQRISDAKRAIDVFLNAPQKGDETA